MSEEQIRYVSRAVARYLFVNGNGDQADRLVLTAKDGRDLGGWCEQAVRDAVEDHIREALRGTPS